MTLAILDNDRPYFSPNIFPIYPVTMAIVDNANDRPYFSPNIFPIYPVTMAIVDNDRPYFSQIYFLFIL